MKRRFVLLLFALPLVSLAVAEAVPVPCDCATCLLSPDRLCTEPETVKVWRCGDYTAGRCPVSTAAKTGLVAPR